MHFLADYLCAGALLAYADAVLHATPRIRPVRAAAVWLGWPLWLAACVLGRLD